MEEEEEELERVFVAADDFEESDASDIEVNLHFRNLNKKKLL